MAVNRCPSCSSQVLPGEVNCRRCGFDFILGKKPEDWNPIDQARRQRTLVLSALAGVLLITGIVVVLVVAPGGDDADTAPADPCLVALSAMQPVINAAVERGNPVPRCEETPPGAADCWTAVDLKVEQYASAGVSFTLRPGGSGFELQCLVDADGDGQKAVYKANAVIDGVKISDSAIK